MAAFKPRARPFASSRARSQTDSGRLASATHASPLQRFSGVLAPRSSWRRDVVAMCPRPAATTPAPRRTSQADLPTDEE